jgi:hypothetical protein
VTDFFDEKFRQYLKLVRIPRHEAIAIHLEAEDAIKKAFDFDYNSTQAFHKTRRILKK